MNPNNFVFKDWHLFNYSLHMICDSGKIAKLVQNLDMPEEKYERIFGRPKAKKDDPKNPKANAPFVATPPPPAAMKTQNDFLDVTKGKNKSDIKKDSLAIVDNDDEARLSLIKSHKTDNESIKKSKVDESRIIKPGFNSVDQNKNNGGGSSRDIELEIDRDYERYPKP